MTNADKFLRYSGVVGVVVLWAGTVAGMLRAHLSLLDRRPISYLGVNHSSAVWFSVTLLISAVLFSVFGIHTYYKFNLSKKFIAAFLVGQVGQMIAAVVPYGGKSKLIHTYAAFTLAFSLMFLLYFFKKSQKPEKFHNMGEVLFKSEAVAFIIGIGTFVFIKKVAPLSEILPSLPFHAWLIWTGQKVSATD